MVMNISTLCYTSDPCHSHLWKNGHKCFGINSILDSREIVQILCANMGKQSKCIDLPKYKTVDLFYFSFNNSVIEGIHTIGDLSQCFCCTHQWITQNISLRYI